MTYEALFSGKGKETISNFLNVISWCFYSVFKSLLQLVQTKINYVLVNDCLYHFVL